MTNQFLTQQETLVFLIQTSETGYRSHQLEKAGRS